MRFIGALLLTLVCLGCSSLVQLPYRAKLFGPGSTTPPRLGAVIAERADGARLFAFDDHTEGDNGFMWIHSDDTRYRIQRDATPRRGFMEAGAEQR